MDVLVVVDMQNDFIGGSLGSKEAAAIVPKVAERVRSFDGPVLFTRDTHGPDYLSTQEGRKLPVLHCVAGTDGWRIAPELASLVAEPPVDKPAFGSLALAEKLKAMDREQGVGSVTLVGLCTDICVISNAMILKAALPEVPIFVDAACCAGVTPEAHRRALEAMRSCQIDVLNA